MIRAALPALALTGCIQSALESAPCPCEAPEVCCEAIGQCVADEAQCPTPAPPLDAFVVYPDEGPPPDLGPAAPRLLAVAPEGISHRGGDWLSVTLSAPVTGAVVQVGGQPCAPVEAQGATLRCRAPRGSDVQPLADLRVVGTGPDGPGAWRWPDAVRYRLPAFADVTDRAGVQVTPAGQCLAVADLGGGRDLFVTRLKRTEQSEQGQLWRQTASWRWADDTGADWVQALPEAQAVKPAHVNSDGVLDLLVWRGAVDGVAFALDGAQGWAALPWGPPDRADGQAPVALPLDLDGDGRPEWFGVRNGCDCGENAFFVVTADGQPVAPLPVQVTDGSGLADGPMHDWALLDADGDGDADVVGCNGGLWAFEQAGGRLVQRLDWLPQGVACHGVAAGDLDLDGRMDLVAVAGGDAPPGQTLHGLTLLRQTAEGFEPWAPVPDAGDCAANRAPGTTLPLGLDRAVLLDQDHDGDLDVLLPQPAARCPGDPLLYRSQVAQGRLEFTPEAVPTAWRNGAVAAALADDLDGDGDLDVVAQGGALGAEVRLLRNTHLEGQGGGAWLAVRVTAGQHLAYGAVVELDVDGPEGAPDFAPGPGKLQVRMVGDTATAASDGPVHFGLGEPAQPVWVRVRFPGGRELVELVGGLNTTVHLAWEDAR